MKPDTELPAMPTNVLESPDESIYHKAQAEIDEKIDLLNQKAVSCSAYLTHSSFYIERAW